MIGLVLDTSMDKAVIGLSVNGNRDISISNKPRHNAALLPSIDDILRRNNISISQIDYFGVVIGPGSFTGIRVGVSTINAFCYALGRQAVAINALELLNQEDANMLALIDARHGNYYTALYKDNKVEYAFLNESEIAEIPCNKVYRTEIDAVALINIFEKKVQKGEFSTPIRPFYMRLSSAETGV